MAEVKILIEGYARQIEDGWIASSTVTLVKTNGIKVIVDPGCNRKKLIGELAKNALKPADIDFVLLTHNHTDHTVLTGIFENAKVLNDSEVYDNDKQVEHGGIVPGTDLKIISTPGHDQFHCSLIVPTKEGVYIVVGDVFWWMDDEDQKTDYSSLLEHNDLYVKNKTQITESRKKILKLADYIIPGHGKMFKIQKGNK